MQYSAISVKGGKDIVKAMKRLAMSRSLESGKVQNVGELVHKALISTYGEELERELSFFATNDDTSTQSGTRGNA